MKRLVVGFILITLFVGLGAVQAAIRQDVDWSVHCDGFRSNGGSIFLNRDNTGQGRETIAILATDGAGNVIFGPVRQSAFIGLSLEFPEGVAFSWSAKPVANPLRVRVISVAGNSLGQQLVYAADSVCPELETPAAGIINEAVTQGEAEETTPPVQPPSTTDDPNVPIPVLTNPDDVAQTRSGYLVVDTSAANLRSADGTQYTIVGRVQGGEELVALGTNAGRNWWFVEVGSIRGWISNELVIIRGNLSDVAILEPEGELFGPRLYTFTANDLLQSPRLGAPVICVIPGEREYFINGQTSDGLWLALDTPCGLGWLQAERGALRNSGGLDIPVIPG